MARTETRGRESAMEYAARCKTATTNQGLDAVTELLDREDIAYEVDQTGGFCMMVRVQPDIRNYPYVGITSAPLFTGGPEGTVYVCLYTSEEHEGAEVAEALPLSELVAMLNRLFSDEVEYCNPEWPSAVECADDDHDVAWQPWARLYLHGDQWAYGCSSCGWSEWARVAGNP
jgi:hypothetical protein